MISTTNLTISRQQKHHNNPRIPFQFNALTKAHSQLIFFRTTSKVQIHRRTRIPVVRNRKFLKNLNQTKIIVHNSIETSLLPTPACVSFCDERYNVTKQAKCADHVVVGLESDVVSTRTGPRK